MDDINFEKKCIILIMIEVGWLEACEVRSINERAGRLSSRWWLDTVGGAGE